jgi:3-deoxy-D-manno-octulosonate 8-phosphate phosphatase (KDO 8-P phosphatase)
MNRITEDVMERASRIRLLLMDVDGVLTDGKFYFFPGPDGEIVETKAFDSQDGIALQWLRRKGIAAGLISGRISPATTERATQAGFRYVYQGNLEKTPILEEIRAQAGLDPSQIAYIGDDFTDVVVMHRVGLAIATRNAAQQVKDEADFVTGASGGSGAVREAVELILTAQGLWTEILQEYEIGSELGRRRRPVSTAG